MEATTQAEIVAPCMSQDCPSWNPSKPFNCKHSVEVSDPVSKCFNYTAEVHCPRAVGFTALGEGE